MITVSSDDVLNVGSFLAKLEKGGADLIELELGGEFYIITILREWGSIIIFAMENHQSVVMLGHRVQIPEGWKQRARLEQIVTEWFEEC